MPPALIAAPAIEATAPAGSAATARRVIGATLIAVAAGALALALWAARAEPPSAASHAATTEVVAAPAAPALKAASPTDKSDKSDRSEHEVASQGEANDLNDAVPHTSDSHKAARAAAPTRKATGRAPVRARAPGHAEPREEPQAPLQEPGADEPREAPTPSDDEFVRVRTGGGA